MAEAQLTDNHVRTALIDRLLAIQALTRDLPWADEPDIRQLWTALEVIGATVEGHIGHISGEETR